MTPGMLVLAQLAVKKKNLTKTQVLETFFFLPIGFGRYAIFLTQLHKHIPVSLEALVQDDLD